MSGSKIRNIAIVSLLLINMLFLAVIIIDAADDVRARREALENVSAILRANGIAINPDLIRDTEPIRTMRTFRDIQSEEKIAQALLWATVKTDQGIIYSYENPNRGIAFFYSAGDFSVQMIEGAIQKTPDGAIRTVESILRNMNIETAEITKLLATEDDIEIITAVAAYRGISVFNGIIEFKFVGDSLKEVSGRYVTGIEPIDESTAISHVGTALLVFLSAVRDESRQDIFCTEIFNIEAGFRHRPIGLFGEGVIEPAWMITTDNGRFMIDDTTGEIWIMG